MADDDDDISITSTAPSEQLSEYEVEAILTERQFDNQTMYLVKWTGYSLERSTWEPADSFLTDETFVDWRKKKKAIAEGRHPAFDLVNFENHLLALERGRQQRKRKREAKRQRLGLSRQQTDPSKKQRVDPNHAANLTITGPGSAKSRPPLSEPIRQIKVPLKPPMVMFGSSQNRPAPWMAIRNKQRKPTEPDGQPKSFNLSTKWRLEKAKGYERPPDINQLELARPSGWPPRTGNNPRTPKIGNHFVSSPKADSPLLSPRERNNLNSDHDRLPPSSPNLAGNGFRQSRVSDSWKPDFPVSWEYSRPDRRNSGYSWISEVSSSQDPWGPELSNSRGPWVPERTASRDSWRSEYHTPPQELSRAERERLGGDTWRPEDRKPSPPPLPNRFEQPQARQVPPSRPEGDTHPAQNLEDEPIPPLPPRRPATIKGANHRRAKDDNFQSRFWNPGEVFVYMYFGPDKKSIGPVRLCGMSGPTKTRIMQTKKERRIEIWFQELCTPDDYKYLCSRSYSNIRYDNGWIEGYDDTEPDVYKSSQTLERNHLLAISYPEEPSHGRNVLIALSPFSPGLEFLRGGYKFSEDTFLQLTVRSPLMRLKKPSLFDRVSRPSISTRIGATQFPLPENYLTGPSPIAPELGTGEASLEDTAEFQPAPAEDVPSDTQSNNQIRQDVARAAEDQRTSEKQPLPKKKGSSKEKEGQAISQEKPQQKQAAKGHREEATTETPVQESQAPLSVENFDVDVFFRDVFKMTFDTLATIDGMEKGKAQVFYLMCPPEDASIQDECGVLIEFLKRHRGVVFSNRFVEEDWERFVRTVNQGVVVFHESFLNYDLMPNLKDLIQKSFTFWSFSLTGIGHGEDKTYFQRLFPHGGVLLLTEDFMFREPDATVIILAWFNDWSKKRFPGIWKLMLRPNVLEWLLAQPEPEEKSRQGVWITMHSLIIQLSITERSSSIADHDLLDGIHDGFSEKRVISPKIPLYGSRTEDDCPALPKGLTQEQRDTDHLAEFFAGWALVNSHRFRRFVIVTTLKPLKRWDAWNHVDVKESAGDFFRAYGVDYRHHWDFLRNYKKQSCASADGKKELLPSSVSGPPGSSSRPTISKPMGT